jgi:hypothetical protein
LWARIGGRQRGLTVHLAPVSDFHHQHPNRLVFDSGDQPVVANTVLPELAQIGALERFVDAAWVIQRGHAPMQERQDATGNLGVELGKFF